MCFCGEDREFGEGWRAVSCVRVGSTFAVCDLKRTLIC